MTVAHTGVITLDCADPLELATFWAAMLGGTIVYQSERTVAVRAPWLALAAVKIDNHRPPTWPEGDVPQQIHLDLAVTELDEAAALAEKYGARPAPFQPAPQVRRILFDPAGHPFCLTTQVPSALL